MSTANSLTLTVSRPIGLDSPQKPFPQGVEVQGSETSGHLSFLSDMPLDILHPRPLDACSTSTFFLRQQSFPPNKASLASPPDCLTAAPGKYPSSWVSIGNEAWQAAGCGYYREIETQSSSAETQKDNFEFSRETGAGGGRGNRIQGTEVRFKA